MSFYRIRPRAGTATQWELVNPVLGEREIGFEVPESGVGSGNVKMKMGDGVTTWNELPYAILSGISPEDIVHNGETNDPNKIVGADAFYSLFQNVATLNDSLNNYLVKHIHVFPYEIKANGSTNFNITENIARNGYTPIGIVGYAVNALCVNVLNLRLLGTAWDCYLQNLSGEDISSNLHVEILYIKNT